MNSEKICKSVIELAIETGKFIKKERKKFQVKNVEVKGLHNFVTHVDKASEKRITEGLKKILPGSGFIAEEETEVFRSDTYNWVIDPLDGTTNFIHGLPPYAVSIGLLEKDRLIAGVIYEVTMEECFYAWEDSNAFLNGKEIKVSEVSKVQESFVGMGFPYNAFDRMEPFMKSLDYFMRETPGVRRLGSAATDLAYVACGRFDAFYEYNLNPWDVAAGAFIVQQAGGKNSDFSGGNNYIFGGEIVSANPHVHEDFRKIVAGFMLNKK